MKYLKLFEDFQLNENLWDRIKNVPKALFAKLKGGPSYIMAKIFIDSGIKIGKYFYMYDVKNVLQRWQVKSIDYNTGDVDMTIEYTEDGKNWTPVDDARGLKHKLELEEDLSKILKMSEEDQKEWYERTVAAIKRDFERGDVAYSPEELKSPVPKKDYEI